MEKVTFDEREPSRISDGSERRALSDALGTTDVAINHYRIAPGDGLPGGLHAHMDQEELFVVLEGTATFETTDGSVTVQESEAVRFGRGEFQSGRNDAEQELVLLALGGPRETDDIRIPAACPDCGHDDLRVSPGGDRLTFECPGCGSNHAPADCPECGHSDLRLTLDERDETVAVCQNCAARFDRPPLRD